MKKTIALMKERKEKRTLPIPIDFLDPFSEMSLSSAKISSESPSNLNQSKIN